MSPGRLPNSRSTHREDFRAHREHRLGVCGVGLSDLHDSGPGGRRRRGQSGPAWLAAARTVRSLRARCTHPRLRVTVDRCSFGIERFHLLLHAGLSRRFLTASTPTACDICRQCWPPLSANPSLSGTTPGHRRDPRFHKDLFLSARSTPTAGWHPPGPGHPGPA